MVSGWKVERERNKGKMRKTSGFGEKEGAIVRLFSLALELARREWDIILENCVARLPWAHVRSSLVVCCG